MGSFNNVSTLGLAPFCKLKIIIMIIIRIIIRRKSIIIIIKVVNLNDNTKY